MSADGSTIVALNGLQQTAEVQCIIRVSLKGHGGRLAGIWTRLGAIQGRLEHHQDELNVVSVSVSVSVLAMRATSERVAWASLQKQLAKLAARVEALERGER